MLFFFYYQLFSYSLPRRHRLLPPSLPPPSPLSKPQQMTTNHATPIKGGPNDENVIWALVFVCFFFSFFFTNLCFSFLLLLFLGFDIGITRKWLRWRQGRKGRTQRRQGLRRICVSSPRYFFFFLFSTNDILFLQTTIYS
jgi:hypothetical protein